MHTVSQAVSAAVTRPADTTPYTSGDLVANSVTAGSVAPLTFTSATGFGAMVAARIEKSDKSTTNASFDLHLFGTSPVVTNGDNGALAFANLADYLGKVSVTVAAAPVGTSSGSSGSASASAISPGGGVIYGLLAATAAYTPASGETFTVTLFHRV